ncbi:hypothetical protein IAT38_007097 [Cryptococcus sp. DSM 104549]
MKFSSFFSLSSFGGNKRSANATYRAEDKHSKHPRIATYTWPQPLDLDSAILELPTAAGLPPKFVVATWAGETSSGVVAESVVLPLPAQQGGKGRGARGGSSTPSLDAMAEAEQTRTLLASLSPSPSSSSSSTPGAPFPTRSSRSRLLRRSRTTKRATHTSTEDFFDHLRSVLSQREYDSYVLLRLDSRRALEGVARLGGAGLDGSESWMSRESVATLWDERMYREEKWVGAEDVPAVLRSRISSVSSLSC